MKKRLLTLLTAFTLLMSVLVVPVNATDSLSNTVDKYDSYVYNDYMSYEFRSDSMTFYNLTFDGEKGHLNNLNADSLSDFCTYSELLIVVLWTKQNDSDVLLNVGYFEELCFDQDTCSFVQLNNSGDRIYKFYDFFNSSGSLYSLYNVTFIRDNAINLFDYLQPFYNGCIQSTITNKEAKITSINNYYFTYVHFPETLYGKPLTTLESGLFSHSLIREVYLPDSLKSINASCFAYCDYLEKVSIGSNVEFIGSSCFAGTYFPYSITSRDGDRTYFLSCDSSSSSSFFISDDVDLIAGGALRNTSFNYISFSKDLMFIGPKSFFQNEFTTVYDFSKCNQIPNVHADSFDFSLLASANAKIIVPSALYDEWIKYSKWNSFLPYITPLSYLDAFEQGYNDGYTQGNTDGIAAGTEIGYQNGYSQGNTDGIAAGTEIGYQNGYTQGKTDGISEGTNIGYNNGYQGGYNDGVIKGQTDSDIVEKGINGFFTGLTAFFAPFLTLGFGGITVASLLGLAVTVFIIILIYKLTRG